MTTTLFPVGILQYKSAQSLLGRFELLPNSIIQPVTYSTKNYSYVTLESIQNSTNTTPWAFSSRSRLWEPNYGEVEYSLYHDGVEWLWKSGLKIIFVEFPTVIDFVGGFLAHSRDLI